MTDFDADVSSTSAVPTSDDYVGCFNDLIADRVLTTVTTDDALTPAVSVESLILLVRRSRFTVYRSPPDFSCEPIAGFGTSSGSCLLKYGVPRHPPRRHRSVDFCTQEDISILLILMVPLLVLSNRETLVKDISLIFGGGIV